MPSGQEILNSLFGAWRILRMDPAALSYFNLSIEGFWRSFFAIALVAPMLLVITLIGYGALPPAEGGEARLDPGSAATVHLVALALAWAAFPLAMIWVSRLLDLSGRYVPFIVAWNWSNVIGAAIFLVVTVLFSIEAFPRGIATALSVFAFGYVLFYNYLVAKLALACATGTAIGLVVFEVVLEHLIDLATTAALRPLL